MSNFVEHKLVTQFSSDIIEKAAKKRVLSKFKNAENINWGVVLEGIFWQVNDCLGNGDDCPDYEIPSSQSISGHAEVIYFNYSDFLIYQ